MSMPFRVLGRLHLLSATGAQHVHGHRSAQRRQLSSQGSYDMSATSISAGSCISGIYGPDAPAFGGAWQLPDFQPGN